jgi:coenzyme F420 hydrogenase subunit beta
MEHSEIKTFVDLDQQVVQMGLCEQCGGCVSFCTAGRLNALEVGPDGLPRFSDEENCVRCGICYMICPVTKDLDHEVNSRYEWHLPIGTYRTITSARATDPSIQAVATDGGVVTALLAFMLDKHLIDGAIVSRSTTPFSREAVVATTREDLLAAAGSTFGSSSHLEDLGDRDTTYSPTISAVKSLEGRHLHSVAVVGTPCQIKTIRKMQSIGILPAHIITYAIGLFCTENFSFDAAARAKLEGALGVDLDCVRKLNIKDKVLITLDDGSVVQVLFEQIDEIARQACLACTDFSNDYADISVGGLGSLSGFTTVLIRSEKAEKVFRQALRQGYLEERSYEDGEDLRSQKTRMMAQVVAFAQRKRSRGEEHLAELAAAPTESGSQEE